MIASRHARSVGLAAAMVVAAIVGAERSTPAQPIDCDELPAGLTDCVRDQDCLYQAGIGLCDCMNGGTEIAIHRGKLPELNAWRAACDPGGCLFVSFCLGVQGARCEQGTCVLGSCGDGIVPPFEACDGGGPSATCDADCTVPDCGDWTVNATAGESCDDGNVADGDGCSSLCACDDGSDADGDGVGDACDDCVATPDGAIRSVLTLRRVGTDVVAGDDGLQLKMDLALGAGAAFADLDPVSDGLGLLLRRSAGTPVLELAVPTGAFDGTVGWRANAGGTVWSFLDKSAGPVATGIRKAKIVDRNAKLPGGVSLKLTGRDASYVVGPFDAPLRVTAVLGAGPGHCAERIHDRADCGVTPLGDGIKCRR